MKDQNRPIVTATAEPTLLKRLKLNWRPQPVTKPQLDPQFDELDHLRRTTEAMHYTIRRLEWWISPRGSLREWLRFNLMVTALLGFPSVLVVPLITYLLGQFATWSELLTRIGGNLMVFPITILIGVGLLSAATIILQRLLRR